MKQLLLLLTLIACCSFQQITAQQSASLPIDPDVRMGKLSNGLTYYIQRNIFATNRADFFIAQKVGSIQEESNQLGLAHFLEHMCFNGTTHFPGGGLKQYLERIGVKFGENLNAYTSVDETVYNICNVPVNTPGAIDSCLMILHDWSNGLTLDPVEINKERGVINEEWRTRMNAMQRLQEKMLPVMFPGTKYATCFPIGTMEVVMNFKPQALRDYYEKWYRPDLQGIIIVGDILVDDTEAQIKRIFADIPAQPNPAKREYYPVNDNKEPIIFIGKDKEQSSVQAFIYNKHEATPDDQKNSMDYLAKSYSSYMITCMLNQRLNELLQKANPPFVEASVFEDNFIVAKTKQTFTGMVGCAEGSIEQGFRTLLREMERARRFGFTENEYNRARTNYLQGWERAYNERDKRKNAELTNQCIRHFLDQEPLLGIENQFKIFSQIASGVTVGMLNDMMKKLITDTNQAVAIFAPEKNGLSLPTKESIKKLLEEVKKEELTPYEDKHVSKSLIKEIPKGGKIISETIEPIFGTTLLTLSNGVKVMIKNTNFKADEILMKGVSLGGSSLFPDSEIANINFMQSAGVGGLGDLNAIDIGKILTGKQATAGYNITNNTEYVDGNCAPKDFETMLQLAYLIFTAIRQDDEAFASYKERCRESLLNQEMDPGIAFYDSINYAIKKGHPRTQRFNSQMLTRTDYNKILAMHRDRYKDASDFTFIFIGNVDTEKMKPLIATYLGALPSINRKETFLDNNVKNRKGVYKNIFYKKQNVAKASNFMSFIGDCSYNLRNMALFDMSCQILNLIYTEKIREQEGGTYGVFVGGNLSKYPEEIVGMQISFDTSPTKREALLKIIYDELEQISKVGPTQENLNKVKEFMLKKYAENLNDNGLWLSWIDEYLYTGVNPIDNYEEFVKGFTVKDVADFIGNLIKQKNQIEISMISPEEDKPQ
ncbi:insulinase family protein [Bacteroides sp.]|uniref:M16 family metallopeptidase n=1 Tax=Bacteroides sp. TaxID=29523 RepID=UPI002629CD03|nr:insulinase family protein [Bacteroides sp.]MDD3036804.1 insulinase family protein [Bacteroides sp.]